MSSIRDFIPLTKLGQGTFSTVYKVRRLSDQKIYALKKIRMNNLTQKQKENALNQIRILASFDCQNIVAYKQAFFEDKINILCIVMEFADGGDLHKLVTETKKYNGSISEITIWHIASDILSALDHLHMKGILHRDLKTANIFIHADSYKLGDLNVSKVNAGKLAFTQTGTPYYASPQIWRDQPYDLKSDIWSFGCILYELVCLEPPFRGRDMDELYEQIQKNRYTAIPHPYSAELASVIDQCLQKNPMNRPKTSHLLNHANIQKFRNRKNTAFNQPQMNKQLLKTITLPNNLRELKMKLPNSKYENQGNQHLLVEKQWKGKNQWGGLSLGNSAISNNISNITNNNNHNSSKILKLNPPQFPSPSTPTPKPNPQLPTTTCISPQELLSRKLTSARNRNSQKKPNHSSQTIHKRYKLEHGERKGNDRYPTSLQKHTIYNTYIEQHIDKKMLAMPRTEKRVASSNAKIQNFHHFLNEIPEDLILGQNKNGKDHDGWKKKLVKKSCALGNHIAPPSQVFHVNI